ncbi:polysaccharide deacetylase family protein [Sphingomonas sp. R-74633]|uniref:polysaccharide deacetylase family protein n=1 Tax=Sphingomonas sp. R-74633 TaxID=2751188 RepID=UPI0015D2A005|nr:polysaccharide deacetylase family protein [Sphingomonas sp. R-74633]NYT40488.1 polysaccharide deacetylase family protein [Sphingomonas sp. R-74633]
MTGLRFILKALIACIALALVVPGKQTISVSASTPPAAAKRIAFTFDDVPRGSGAFLTQDERTTKLIAMLRSRGVSQVALFVNPGRIDNGAAGKAAMKRIADYVAAGNVLANHTWLHPHLSKVTTEEFLSQVDLAQAWLDKQPNSRRWLRFPFLDEGGPDKAKVAAIRAGLAARHIQNGYVTAEASDWNIEGLTIAAKKDGKPIDMAGLRDLYVESHVQAADFADELAIKTIGRSPAHVMLLHETDIAALFIGDLIDALRRDGWEIITPDAAYADPIRTAMPEVPWTNGTLTEQMAWEKKIPPPRYYDRNDLKIANPLFNERVLHEKAQ